MDTQQTSERWLTAKEAAEVLRVHVETLYRLVSMGEVPARKLGGRWRFLASELTDVGRTVEPSRRQPAGNWKDALRAVNPYGEVA